jgi:hypothetical protein
MPIIEPVGPPSPEEKPGVLSRQLVWFAILWFAGLLATAVVAYGLRALIL